MTPSAARRATPSTAPTFTVVVPCYNYGHYLPFAVGSVTDQDGVDVEVIVVDDASTDDSLEVANRLAARDSRVRVIANPKNLGHIATYNVGLGQARGDFVLLLSADDALAPGALARAAATIARWPATTLVYGFAEAFEDVPPPVGTRWWSRRWSGHDWIRIIARYARNPIFSPEAIIRRTALEQVGGYEAGLPHAADMAMWLEMAMRGDVARVNGATQAFYRVHGSNMHMTTFTGPGRDLRERVRVFGHFFAGSGGRLPDADRLSRRAHRAIARDAVWLSAVVSRQAGHDSPEADDLRRLAVDVDPGVARTPLWWLASRRATPVTALLVGVYDRMWWVRAKRIRRFGT